MHKILQIFGLSSSSHKTRQERWLFKVIKLNCGLGRHALAYKWTLTPGVPRKVQQVRIWIYAKHFLSQKTQCTGIHPSRLHVSPSTIRVWLLWRNMKNQIIENRNWSYKQILPLLDDDVESPPWMHDDEDGDERRRER